jgi:CheY-like chemotaxis protein
MARVLVVVEDRELRATIRDLISGAGHEVACARVAADARRLLAAAPFDVLVVDLDDGPAAAALAASAGGGGLRRVTLGGAGDEAARGDVALPFGCTSEALLAAIG